MSVGISAKCRSYPVIKRLLLGGFCSNGVLVSMAAVAATLRQSVASGPATITGTYAVTITVSNGVAELR